MNLSRETLIQKVAKNLFEQHGGTITFEQLLESSVNDTFMKRVSEEILRDSTIAVDTILKEIQ